MGVTIGDNWEPSQLSPPLVVSRSGRVWSKQGAFAPIAPHR